MTQDNPFKAARTGAGLTQEDAASICRLSTDSYRTREKSPGEFRLKELLQLSESMGDSSKKILLDAINSLFLHE